MKLTYFLEYGISTLMFFNYFFSSSESSPESKRLSYLSFWGILLFAKNEFKLAWLRLLRFRLFKFVFKGASVELKFSSGSVF